ncbi:TPA: tautomerase family protein, partial [Streptococcus agalactiae]|nr:tautomerase family protein [Streptococcus agalactiae]
EVVSRIAKAPKENIHVFINDMPEGTYYPQGELKKK